ncbi:MAG: hypothetical protein QM728_08440 [Gordonia sp. (in: high G+C Gram-positive bacteria)]|uniref:hypothetical protein n=1 Tax=Gordonia sp. (in: high G+C Gram-positive bacteria) TaxID=84139 RepID=UPI0039E5DD87
MRNPHRWTVAALAVSIPAAALIGGCADPRPPTPTKTLVGFVTPDNETICSGHLGGALWGGVPEQPRIGCYRNLSSLPKPSIAGCSMGMGRFGGAASLGPDWVTTGLCASQSPFLDDTASYPRTEVGDVIAIGGGRCAVAAVDTVTCHLGANGFTLSPTVVTPDGRDRTAAG